MTGLHTGVMLAFLVAAALFGWFMMAAMPRGALLFGLLLGAGGAGAMVPSLAALPARPALMLALGFGLFAVLLYAMTARDMGMMDLGLTEPRVMGTASAIAGLFGGLAVRAATQAAFGRKEDQ